MGDRSGVGVVELAILESLRSRGATARRRPAQNTKVLADVEERIGLAPGYAYEVLLDLARPWRVPIRLVDGIGNYGSLVNGPASAPRHTAARLSLAGEIAVAAEHGELAPVPIGLINGNAYRDGSRPPFRPGGLIEAIRLAIRQPRVTGRELVGIIGMPDFLTGCTVTGNLTSLAAGRQTELRLQARVSIADDHRSVVIENMPPNADRDQVHQQLAHYAGHSPPGRTGHLPIADIRDIARAGDDRFICVPEPGVTPEWLRDQLLDFDGITTTVPAALPASLPTLIRRFVGAHSDEDLLASLARLEDAISKQPFWM